MKNLFNDISQEERNRILEMHQSATRKNYLSEQAAPAQSTTPTGPTGATNTPQTPSDPIITLMSGITNADTFSITPIVDSTDDLVKFFKFSEIKAQTGDGQPDPALTKTRGEMQNFVKSADKYYISKKMSPKGSYSLTSLFGTNPTVTQLLSPSGVNPAKFTKTGLDTAYYNYFLTKLQALSGKV
jgi:hypothetical protein